jgi:Domain of unknown function (DU1801)
MNEKPPEIQLSEFIAKFNPEIAELAWESFAKLRKRLAGAVIFVYDNSYALVMGFGPTERPSEAILSIVVYPRWVTLCFLYGVNLTDPNKLLNGSGKQVRHIRLENAKTLDKPVVKALISEAVANASQPFMPTGADRMIIKCISANQRPRGPQAVAKRGKRRVSD